MRMTERHGEFLIAWEEPPLIGYKWVMSITSEDPRMFAIVRRSTVTLIAPTRSRALTDAREFVAFIRERVTSPATAGAKTKVYLRG
jgi:hypothetical protein